MKQVVQVLVMALLGCSCSTTAPAAIVAPGVIQGLIVDREGRPTAGKVSVVRQGGSRSMGVGKGVPFVFGGLGDGPYVVTATTEGGLISIEPNVSPGAYLRLPRPTAGATIIAELRGRPTARLGVIRDSVRIHDFTIRVGEPVDVVVPEGVLELVAYEHGVELRRTVRLELGARTKVLFDLVEVRP